MNILILLLFSIILMLVLFQIILSHLDAPLEVGLGIEIQFQNQLLKARNQTLVKLQFDFHISILVCTSFFLGGEKRLLKIHLSLNYSF